MTVDYFTPIHDDPFIFGQIAAANSLSDVYAMGARPLLVMNICGFPACDLPLDLVGQVLKGGSSIAAEAGIPVAGGHTIDNPELFYGMVALGLVHPDKIMTNTTARTGDRLILTKPLGTGIITTAAMADVASDAALEAAVKSMITLNKAGSEIAMQFGASAMTDVTGFGLIGHAHEMAHGSGVQFLIRVSDLPLLPETLQQATQGLITGVGQKNRLYYQQWADFGALSDEQVAVVCDAQTSGGLLVSFPRETVGDALAAMRNAGIQAALVGEVVEGEAGKVSFQ